MTGCEAIPMPARGTGKVAAQDAGIRRKRTKRAVRSRSEEQERRCSNGDGDVCQGTVVCDDDPGGSEKICGLAQTEFAEKGANIAGESPRLTCECRSIFRCPHHDYVLEALRKLRVARPTLRGHLTGLAARRQNKCLRTYREPIGRGNRKPGERPKVARITQRTCE